jgi:hypothetical protein
MRELFEGDRKAHDRDRAGAAKVASAFAVATQLLGCEAFEAQGSDGQESGRCACPLGQCWPGPKVGCALICSTSGAGWRCSCGANKGDTIDLVRAVRKLGFGEAVGLLADFGASHERDDLTGDLF